MTCSLSFDRSYTGQAKPLLRRRPWFAARRLPHLRLVALSAEENWAQGEALADEHGKVVSDILNNMVATDPDPVFAPVRATWGIPEPEDTDLAEE